MVLLPRQKEDCVNIAPPQISQVNSYFDFLCERGFDGLIFGNKIKNAFIG
jgi:hypothetical protein